MANGILSLVTLLLVTSNLLFLANGFLPSTGFKGISHPGQIRSNGSMRLELAKKGGNKRRRRKRKEPPKPVVEEPISVEQPRTEVVPSIPKPVDFEIADTVEEEEVDVSQLVDVAKFSFDDDSGIEAQSDEIASPQESEGAIPLPDIKEALKKKEQEEQLARMEEEKEANKIKIKRTDKEALLKLLEQQPYADADDSFFEEEEYGTVSALLGERAKPFLGIPSGPLQVGHFIGALVIILMAFIEYPGFPLTNLPTPLRGALQGGLGTVYAINLVLAVLAVFKAGERGQPAALWVAKTFTVGGLAYDQLTQLPTLEQIEKAKSRKGARALKNRKKK